MKTSVTLSTLLLVPSILALTVPPAGIRRRFATAAQLTSSQLFSKRDATCPAGLPQSCVNGASPAGVDSCCTNTPGGQFLQTQFFDTNPPTGPTDSWTIHGLWPDHCDGTYDANCDAAREYTNIAQILQAGGAQSTLDYMNTYWKDYQGQDESFWSHEWGKHGTCISTLEPTCYGSSYTQQEEVVEYFQRTVALFQTLPTYQWLAAAGIVPSTTATYTLAQLQAVANANFGHDAIWNCASGVLNEVWWGFTTSGTIQHGSFTPAGPDGSKSTCPETGIKYNPKTAVVTPPSIPSGVPTGRVFLNVYVQDAPVTKRSVTPAAPATAFFSAGKRLSKRGTPTTPQSDVIRKRQFNPRLEKRTDCPASPMPSGLCAQTCPTNQTPQTDGTCKCQPPYVLYGTNCISEVKTGCLISNGKWFVSGTCAGYTITAVDATTFTMNTSGGRPCQVNSAGVFTCTVGLTPTVFSVDSSNNLVYSGSSDFYAATIAAQQAQVNVQVGPAAHHLKIRYGPAT